jgi:hypothetical protein
MNRRPVESSNIASIGWEPDSEDATTGTLEVEFHHGGVYQYSAVPEQEYQNLIGASSIGRYLATNIVGTYDDRRVSR